ncbi:MAG: hypothetical protein WCK76_04860 [Elusimicrobiota bacterium]
MRTFFSILALLSVSTSVFSGEAAFDQLNARAQARPPAIQSAAPDERIAPASKPVRRAAGIGISHAGDPFDIPDFTIPEIARMVKAAGATHYRAHIPLKEVMPVLSAGDMTRLGKAVRSPALMEKMTGELSRSNAWRRIDALTDAFSQNGIRLIFVVGCGYAKEEPLFRGDGGAMVPASPGGIGREKYLAMVRWLVGAAARRYGDRVEVWQVENELNIAWVVSVVNWRVPDEAWTDTGYCRQLLKTMADTVHEEGARLGKKLKATHNFATGLPWQPYTKDSDADDTLSRIKGLASGPELDIIGIDLYENYFYSHPLQLDRSADFVKRMVKDYPGKPVWVLETGYARGPKERGFTDKAQTDYFSSIFDSCYEAGAEMVLAFGWFYNPKGWWNSTGELPPPWHPLAVEPYWSPLKVSHGPDGARQIEYGKAWDELGKASRKWVGKDGAE